MIAMILATICFSACSLGASKAQVAKTAGTPTPGAIQAPNGPARLLAIQRLNATVGYIAGWNDAGGGLAKTTDNGVTWQRLTDPATSVIAVRFIDERVGWVAGFQPRDVPQVACHQAAPQGSQPCRGLVLRTEDGGRSWKVVLAIPTNGVMGDDVMRQIQAVDGTHAWTLVLDESNPAACQPDCPTEVRRTVDAGRTWTSVLRGRIAGMRFASANRGWVALNPTGGSGPVEVRETSDGGLTWKTVLQSVTGEAMALDAATINTAWLLTHDGAYCSSSSCSRYALFRTDNGGATWLTLGNPKDFAKNCSEGQLAGPLFASVSRGWLGLNHGAGGAMVGGGILQSEDGGWTWRCATSPPMVTLVSAADPQRAWAAGEDKPGESTSLYSTEDGGKTWQRHDLGAIQ